MMDQEREIWKTVYDVWNRYREEAITPPVMQRITEDLYREYRRLGLDLLMFHLSMALHAYFGEKATKTMWEPEKESEQTMMEGI